MIRAVLFDLSPTLIHFPAGAAAELFTQGARRCYAYLSAHELPMPAFEPFCRRQRWIRRRIDWINRLTGAEANGRQFVRRLCRDYGLQRDEASLAKLGWLWYEPFTERAEVAADVIPTLQVLRDHGIASGLVVNTSHQGAVHDTHLQSLGLLEFFPVRAYSTEVGAHKPQPCLFQAAMDEIGVRASQTLFVGHDLRSDILGAHRIGLQTAWLRDDTQRGDGEADHEILRIAELIDVLELPRTPVTHHSPIPALEVERAFAAR